MLCTLLLYTASIAVTLVQLPLSSGCTKRTKKPPKELAVCL